MDQSTAMSLKPRDPDSREVLSAELFEALEGSHGQSVPPDDERPVSQVRKLIAGGLQLGLASLIVVIGFGAYKGIVASAPSAERKERPRVARLVDVVPVETAQRAPSIRGWGEVQPARVLTVRPEVSGTLTYVNPEVTAGGWLREGEVAARIDERDLKLAVLRARTDVARIEARILIEKGAADIGRRDLARRGSVTPEQSALILREPQMAQLDAELASARADLEQAEIALERTAFYMPFDAVVLSESVSEGTTVTVGSEVARLAAADRFKIAVAVPPRALRWVEATGTEVTLTQGDVWGRGVSRTGQVVRVSSSLTETGQMAEVIVEVEDPLSIRPENAGAPRLLLGSLVEATFNGATIENAVALDRAYLRENDTVWVMGADDKLEIRSVDVIWRDSDSVLIGAGLATGDRVVTTPLATFAPGMALRVEGAQG